MTHIPTVNQHEWTRSPFMLVERLCNLLFRRLGRHSSLWSHDGCRNVYAELVCCNGGEGSGVSQTGCWKFVCVRCPSALAGVGEAWKGSTSGVWPHARGSFLGLRDRTARQSRAFKHYIPAYSIISVCVRLSEQCHDNVSCASHTHTYTFCITAPGRLASGEMVPRLPLPKFPKSVVGSFSQALHCHSVNVMKDLGRGLQLTMQDRSRTAC